MEKELVIVGPEYNPRNKKLEGKIKIDWWYVLKCFIGTLTFFGLSKIPVHWAMTLPDFDTGKLTKFD